MIYLIDLPGYGTDNIFEKIIYEQFLSFSSLFIFVVRNSVIIEKDNHEIVNHIFIQAKEHKKKSSSEFLKSCLFILNNDNSQSTNHEDLEKAKDEIIKIIDGLGDDEKKYINLCFFNLNIILIIVII